MYRLENFMKQNAEREFELECAHRNFYHTQMHFNHHTQLQLYILAQRNKHAFKQAFIHMFISFN